MGVGGLGRGISVKLFRTHSSLSLPSLPGIIIRKREALSSEASADMKSYTEVRREERDVE